MHISNILVDRELEENSVVKDYLTTDGYEFPFIERTLHCSQSILGALLGVVGESFEG